MTRRRVNSECRAGFLLAASLFLILGCLTSRANVYATDIKLNGSTNNSVLVAGGGLQISYILNEPATAGVAVKIVSNNAVLWSTNLAWPLAGTANGTNAVTWDGSDQTTGTNAAPGVYAISITAAATGYTNWTNITDDGPNFQVDFPLSIAVNKNTNSPYCGRVLVGSSPPPDAPNVDFDPGIAKFNADGSPADEGGGICNGGYPWSGLQSFSPWKIAISGDDTVYIDDWTDGGIVLAFDEVISTNYVSVLNTNNYAYAGEKLSGPAVTGAAANTLVFMADANTNMVNGSRTSIGILEWALTNNGMLGSNNTGTVVVGISTNTNGLTIAPWDMSIDTNGNIYAIQNLDGVIDPGSAGARRVFCFGPYAGVAETNPVWSIGSTNQDLEKAYGDAVDPTGTFVAVAVYGYGTSSDNLTNGGVNIYYATDGQLVTALNTTNGLDYLPEYTGVAWDIAGNLYATDYGNYLWRAYSPPGANQATTFSVPVVQVYATLQQPSLSAPTALPGQFGFTLQGQSNVTYVIQSSPDLVNWTGVATNYDTAAVRSIILPASATATFYQAVIP